MVDKRTESGVLARKETQKTNPILSEWKPVGIRILTCSLRPIKTAGQGSSDRTFVRSAPFAIKQTGKLLASSSIAMICQGEHTLENLRPDSQYH